MKYDGSIHISFEQISQLLNEGIRDNVDKRGKFLFAHNGGNYLGSPGKEIFFSLPILNEKEFINIAKRVASLFPNKPPSNHLRWAAFIRYIYGCFEKQGCLRSKNDKERMIQENPDWSLSIKFMEEVAKYFESDKNYYGLIIHYEMLAHRYGDKSIIENNKQWLIPMYDCYMKSYNFAVIAKCWKQMFTPFYWAAKYFAETGDTKEALVCYKKCIKLMEKHCPDARPGYRDKAIDALCFLKQNMSNEEKKEFKLWYKKCKNKCLLKVKKHARL